MDVGKPSETKAAPTSKPVITGHKPLIGDPMVREDVPVSELSPTDSEDKPLELEDNKSEPKTEEIDEKDDKPAEDSDDDSPAKPVESKASKSSNSRFKPSDELVEEVKKANAKPSETETALDKAKPETESTDSGESKSDGVIDEVLGDAKGVKEAEIAELERQEAAQKLAASGKYRVKLGAAAHHRGGMQSSFVFGLIMLLLVLVLGYLAIDSGFYKTGLKLPFHVFKQTASGSDTASVAASQKPAKAASSTNSSTGSSSGIAPVVVPAGFTSYKMVDSGTSFAYPATWGNVLVTPEKGYTKRDKNLNSDGVYAYIASFSKNQDVELAVTSNKYLPAARARLYYDYLQWCVTGSQFYNSILNYKTSGGTDTADKVTCDQGPLTAVKLDSKTLQQLSVKDAVSGSTIGDIYSQNLTSTTDIVVLHVKDATAKNAADIQKLLLTVQAAGS